MKKQANTAWIKIMGHVVGWQQVSGFNLKILKNG
jgi:hypothetical protein